jgi:hypothetical protein
MAVELPTYKAVVMEQEVPERVRVHAVVMACIEQVIA